MVKKIIFFSFFAVCGLIPSAHAQVTNTPGTKFREFIANVDVISGETKSVLLQVNTKLRVDTYGDPDLGSSQGFYEYMVTGSVVEGDQNCGFEVLLTQSDVENGDRSGLIKLCSGLMIEASSVRSLLSESSLAISLKAPGLHQQIGSGKAIFNGLKTVPVPSIDD